MTATGVELDPWGLGYVPVAQRRRAEPPAIVWVDQAEQRRDQQRASQPARPAAPARTHRVRAAVLRATYAVQRGISCTLRAIVGFARLAVGAVAIVVAAALLAEHGATIWQEFVALGKPESSAVQVTETTTCAAADKVRPVADLYNGIARTNEAMAANGILDEIGPVEEGDTKLGTLIGFNDCPAD